MVFMFRCDGCVNRIRLMVALTGKPLMCPDWLVRPDGLIGQKRVSGTHRRLACAREVQLFPVRFYKSVLDTMIYISLYGTRLVHVLIKIGRNYPVYMHHERIFVEKRLFINKDVCLQIFGAVVIV